MSTSDSSTGATLQFKGTDSTVRLRQPGPPAPSPVDEARVRLAAKLKRLETAHPGFRFELISFDDSPGRLRIKLKIDAADIWDKVSGSRNLLESRLKSTLEERYGGEVDVSVHSGSLLLTIILSAIDIASVIHQIATTVASLADYVARVIERGRFEWPPVATMFGFFELLKRMILGI